MVKGVEAQKPPSAVINNLSDQEIVLTTKRMGKIDDQLIKTYHTETLFKQLKVLKIQEIINLEMVKQIF